MYMARPVHLQEIFESQARNFGCLKKIRTHYPSLPPPLPSEIFIHPSYAPHVFSLLKEWAVGGTFLEDILKVAGHSFRARSC